MILYNLSCSDFRCLSKRYGVLIPRSAYQSRYLSLHASYCAGNHVSHTVDKPQLCINVILECYFDSIARYKFRLCCSNSLACTALRHFILRSFLYIFIFYIRQHYIFGKFSDERRFSSTNRPNNSQIYFALRSFCYILIYI